MTGTEADTLIAQLLRGDRQETASLEKLEPLLANVLHWAIRLGSRGDALGFWAASWHRHVQGALFARKLAPPSNGLFGTNVCRWKSNPEEQRFAEAWAELTTRGLDARGQHHIDGSMAEDPNASYISPVSPEARMAAATAIQWLGSPVGQNFLRSLGYRKESE
jgi:hypothetical protein